ncbi:MAG: hypothetical protein EP298_12205 [Gammaproteobacteria bacterium]|nr:MAG: hypothetical protein EP298_12205 [Gammaproteobacteria bacterium]UTW43057.1 hypothetical protein KFE69_02630 [bacterium SCSIO 12844]
MSSNNRNQQPSRAPRLNSHPAPHIIPPLNLNAAPQAPNAPRLDPQQPQQAPMPFALGPAHLGPSFGFNY